jgi:hypothetical protein
MLIFFLSGSPNDQFVSDLLHYGAGNFVPFLADLIEVGNGWVEGLLAQLAGCSSVVSNLE